MKALFISLLCLLSIIFPHDICADNSNQDKENILIITSYNSDSKYIYNNIRQFINIYKEIGGSYGIVVENMNETQLTNGHDWVTIVEELTLKHDDAKLIILLGGEAWNGYLFSNNEKIKNIPAICAMGSRYGFTLPDKKNDIHTYIPKSIDLIDEMKNSNVKACYAYDYKMDENIQLVQYFYPDLNHIVFLSDNTYSGLTQQAQIRECLNKNYPQLKTTFIDGRNITMEEAINSVGNLSTQNTVMMMGIWRLDKQNFYFIDNASYAFKMANARLPLFTITSAGLGYWAIGGITPLYDNVSEKLAHKAFQILSSDKEIAQEFICLDNIYQFDYKKLKQFGLNNMPLPSNAIILNKPQKFYDLYKTQVDIIVFIIITLFICLIISLFFYFKTRNLKNKLQLLANQLQKEKTILKASEKELMIAKDNAEKANQLKSKFVSNISHEIRTPLNAIVGFSSLLVNNIDVTNEQKEYAQIIQTNSDLLLQLITDVLEISRLESDKLHFNYEQCHIASHCNNIITFTRMNKKSNIDIEFIHDLTDDFNLYTDSLRLQQVITNLLNNALKFTPEGGKIILTLDTDFKKGFIYFSVKDSGIGVPVEKHKTIFERFEKLDEFIQGTGLGLSICKLIINQMGGDIWVDEKYNEGACFVFSHPIYQ